MAKYPYIVVKDGVWYPSGADVPEGSSEVKETKKSYTKTEISKMTTTELRKLGTEQGIEDAEKKTGAELKRLLTKRI